MRIIFFIGLVALLSACVNPLTPAEIKDLETRSIAFLEPGKTSREEVITEFGAPTSVFENERIFTYRMVLTDRSGLTTSVGYSAGGPHPRSASGYHLVVVFDSNGIVARYRLLKPGKFREPAEEIESMTAPDRQQQ